MMHMQQVLDKHMFDRNNTSYEKLLHPVGQPYAQLYRLAILDELGELNHELKASWCWWKKSQKPIDRMKVLDELVDVLHFVLSWQVADKENTYEQIESAWLPYDCKVSDTVLGMAAALEECKKAPVIWVVGIMNDLGFSIEEVYDAYRSKNAVNHKRQDNGY